VDTGINAIVVLGDFNEDQLKPQNNKMSNIFVKYNMIQFINEPTHFTKNYTIYSTVISNIYVKEWLTNMDKINDIRIGRRD
jgi:hypothetical protein